MRHITRLFFGAALLMLPLLLLSETANEQYKMVVRTSDGLSTDFWTSSIDSVFWISVKPEQSGNNENETTVTGEAFDITNYTAKVKSWANVLDNLSTDLRIGIIYSSVGTPGKNNGTIQEVSQGQLESDASYTVHLSGLSPMTTYYYRSFVYQSGLWFYGKVRSFTTKSQGVNLVSGETSKVTCYSARVSGGISIDPATQYTSLNYGICLYTDTLPGISGKFVEATTKDVQGNFTCQLRALAGSTVYYYRSYAYVDGFPNYGPMRSFTTSADNVVTTGDIDTLLYNVTCTLSIGGGAYSILVPGVCYGMDSVPTIWNKTATTDEVDDEGRYSVTLSPQFEGQVYYRAYLLIDGVAHYGAIRSFFYNPETRNPHIWVIGASPAVGAWSFDKVHQYLYDYKGNGTYTGLIDFGKEGPSGGFKLSNADYWGDPAKQWGLESTTEKYEPATVQLTSRNTGYDIKCYSHRFYYFSFVESSMVLSSLISFDNIGIVGSFNNWNAADKDMKMTYNEYFHRFFIDMTFVTDSELRFTCDDRWDLNWGKDFVRSGENIHVAAGSYRIYFDLNTRTYDFNNSMFGQEEPGVHEPPVTYEGWGIIGDLNEWSDDVPMTEKDGVWTGYINVTETQGWKLRKDAGWDENVGGNFTALGTAFTAEAGGANICLGQAGFFKVVYDTNAGNITVYEGNVWSLIGEFNDWAGDVDMENIDGLWVAKEVELSGEWKLRHNHDWADNRGGKFAELGTPFVVTNGGDNIDCGEAKFNITYDPDKETVTIEKAVKSWSVIGAFTGWSGDVVMTEVAPGIWVSPKTTIAEQGWKVRFDKDWTVNYGGTTPTKVGQFVQAVGNGDNINMIGDLIIVLNLNNGTLGTLGWGVTGSIASCPSIAWSNDIPMNLTSDSTWVSCPIALKTDDEIKIRYGAGWDQNFGGTCVAIDALFEAVAGSDNIKVPANGTYVIAYNPAVGELCVTSAVCGLIGDFNSWSADDFMFYGGEGKYYAFNRKYQGGWMIRMSADWTINRGGNFEWNNPFAVTSDGPNITVEESIANAGFNVIYNAVNETVTINQNIIY